MVINWSLVTCFAILFFAWAGYSRGWWKEALTTALLALLIFFLRQPDWAEWFIASINTIIETIWGFLPDSFGLFISDMLFTIFGIETGGGPLLLNASQASTWVIILGLIVAFSIFMGRGLRDQPEPLGAMLGVLIGGFNGFLILNIFREYLDGRGLPGGVSSTAQASSITLAGSSGVGPPASDVTIQASNLPNFTILDDAVPWILIGGGVLLLLATLNARFGVEYKEGKGRRLNFNKRPPLYKSPPPPKQTELKPLIKDIKKIFEES